MAQNTSLDSHPRTWWQWILVYSPVPLAIITLLQSVFIGWSQNHNSANKSAYIITQNIDCINSPEFLAKRKSPVPVGSGMRVSAVLCNSGYLALYIMPRTSDDGAYRFVELKTLLHENTAEANLAIAWLEQPAMAFPMNQSANFKVNARANLPDAIVSIEPAIQLAQAPQVVCTKTEGSRLIRRIQYADHCETEVIDLNTGNVVNVTSNPGHCDANCP